MQISPIHGYLNLIIYNFIVICITYTYLVISCAEVERLSLRSKSENRLYFIYRYLWWSIAKKSHLIPLFLRICEFTINVPHTADLQNIIILCNTIARRFSYIYICTYVFFWTLFLHKIRNYIIRRTYINEKKNIIDVEA